MSNANLQTHLLAMSGSVKPTRPPLAPSASPQAEGEGSGTCQKRKRNWGVFDDLFESKHLLEIESKRMKRQVHELLPDVSNGALSAHSSLNVQSLLHEALDEYLEDLNHFVVDKFGWTGMNLHHQCPICQVRLEQPHALQCGHVFCTSCIEKIKEVSEERDDDDTIPDPVYVCGMCRQESIEATKLFM